MNAFGRYLLEFLGSIIAIGVLNLIVVHLLRKKFNPITSAIFAFIVNGMIVFFFAPFILTTKNPEAVYLPILLLYLLYDVIRANKLKN
jgi:multisubunit Na+/H+ antiporter MnhE subunit